MLAGIRSTPVDPGRHQHVGHRRWTGPASGCRWCGRARCAAMPSPADSAPCGSRSTSSTRRPYSASAAPRLMVDVVLPTPPFWLHMRQHGGRPVDGQRGGLRVAAAHARAAPATDEPATPCSTGRAGTSLQGLAGSATGSGSATGGGTEQAPSARCPGHVELAPLVGCGQRQGLDPAAAVATVVKRTATRSRRVHPGIGHASSFRGHLIGSVARSGRRRGIDHSP